VTFGVPHAEETIIGSLLANEGGVGDDSPPTPLEYPSCSVVISNYRARRARVKPSPLNKANPPITNRMLAQGSLSPPVSGNAAGNPPVTFIYLILHTFAGHVYP